MAEEGLEGIAKWEKITQNKSSFQVLCERSELIQFEAMHRWKYEWVIFGDFSHCVLAYEAQWAKMTKNKSSFASKVTFVTKIELDSLGRS